jgi:hypothetical protein
VQAAVTTCAHCGGATLRLPSEGGLLLRERISGVGVGSFEPVSGWRDGLRVWATALGGLAAAGVGGWFLGLYGAIAGVTLAWSYGYGRQYRRLVLARRKTLGGAPDAMRPLLAVAADVPMQTGTARPLHQSVRSPLRGEPCLVAAACVKDGDDVVVRTVRAAPFQIVTNAGDELSVSGEVWLDADAAFTGDGSQLATLLHALSVPGEVSARHRAEEVMLSAGDRLHFSGEARTELGAAGYREGSTMVLRGEPSRPIYLRKLTGS